MGGTTWSDDLYHWREEERRERGKSAFVYDEAMHYAPPSERRVHEKMNPYRVLRESRDSAAHPESLAIGVVIDETGSMRRIPIILQRKLSDLMGLLLRKGYAEHPQILIGAVGDTISDIASLQIGQFESGIEIDEDLGRLYLEGNGGPYIQESYQNALYFFARHTSIDCYDKRGIKGYLFVIGDELPYSCVSAREVHKLMGDEIGQDIPVEEIVREVRERYHVFFIIPKGASGGGNATVMRRWVELLGQEYVMTLDDPEAVCETIALAIGLSEEKITLEEGLEHIAEMGVAIRTRESVSTALTPYAKSRTPAARADISGLLQQPQASDVKPRTRRL